MKITKTRLRQIIKEELDALTGDEFSSSMGKLSDLHGELAADLDDLNDYEQIDYILSVLSDSELKRIRVSKDQVKDALMKYPEPTDLYRKVYDDLYATARNTSHRPDGYRWDEVFTRMIVEALGIKPAWTKRMPASVRVKRNVSSLMRSKLFAKASPEDKQVASAKISKALLGLEQYGGDRTFYEEVLDDALGGPRSRLIARLARAAGSEPNSWGEALSAWVSGDSKYAKWMREA